MSIIRQKRRVAFSRKLKACVLCSLLVLLPLFVIISEVHAKPPAEGLTKSEVLLRYGEPKEKIEMSHLKKEVWKYPRRDIVFYEGKVVLPKALKTDRAPKTLEHKVFEPIKKHQEVSLGEVLKSLPKEDDKKPGQVSIPPGGTSSIVQID